jgi:His-Xaa-Ser system protein HxsD
MHYKNHITEREIIVYADMAIYSKDAIFKCMYWYGDKFSVNISVEEESYKIILTPHENADIKLTDFRLYLEKLERDIIDFNLRDIVTKETKNIRDLLVAKAFSNGEFDELPPGEITDPVGFDINL